MDKKEYMDKYRANPEYKERRRGYDKTYYQKHKKEILEKQNKYYKSKKEIYRHWGNSQFIPAYFTPISNREWGNKPHGGLWASPTKDVDIGWDKWCESENFMTDRLDKHFDFILKKRSKILVIKDIKDLEKLPRVYIKDMSLIHISSILDLNADIDFEKLAEKYDAMLVYMYRSTDINEEEPWDNMYHKLYGWDVDTLLVFNPDKIEVIESGE